MSNIMSKKYSLWASFVLLLSIAAISSAATTVTWDNEAGDANWNTGLNWSTDTVPLSTDYAKITMAAGPTLSITQSADIYRVLLDGSNGSMTMDGGTLNLGGSYLGIGYTASTDSGTLTVNSGTINTTGLSGHLYCGVKGNGTLDMSGGAINLSGTFYVARDAGSAGTVSLSGGTITCNALNMNLNDLVTGLGRINITYTGTLIINGDATAYVTTCVTKGWITAYNGAGTVVVDYNNTTPLKTTVTALAPTKAANPSPDNNAVNVSILADLSWAGMLDANSHNVYFGTVSPGTFQTNTKVTTFDPCRLDPNTTYYWQIDEVNDANVVTTGDVWMFTTGSVVATLPNPADSAVNVSISGTTLSWTAGVTASSHDVYFGTISPGTFQTNTTETTFDPCTLAVDTIYYWRIDEVEDINNVYTGDVWSFTTGSFKKGAYLIYPGDNTQMTVLWQLTGTSSCTLAWGLDPNCSTGSTVTSEYGTDNQHKYTITGLSPGTKYYYQITAGSFTSTGSFRAAPAADATSVKFFAYGDTRTYPAYHSEVCAGMNSVIAGDPDFQTMLLHTGDWVAADAETNWANEFFNRSYPAQLQIEATLPIQGCMGNHEGGGTYYTKYWPYPYVAARYWSFDYGPAHIAIVDQYTDYAPGSAQLTWLTNDLSASTKDWKFIVLHQPGWTAAGSHLNDTLVQERIQPLCEQYGVQIVFAGHNHYYARAVVNGVHHITAGGGGAPLYTPVDGQPYIVTYNKTLHYCKITIDGNSLSLQTVKPDGTVIDSFYIDKEYPDFTFIQAADPQMTYCEGSPSNWQVTINKVNILDPAFLIVTGDLLNSPGSQYQADMYFDAAAGLKPGITRYDIPGNHDLHDAPTPTSYAWYEARFGNTWYSFTYGNNLFIALDSCILKDASGYPGKDVNEMDWLTTTLAGASGYDNILVFMHHPLCVSSISEPNAWNNMPLARRSELLTLFHTYGVRAVFAGHYHQNAHVLDGDLEIITTSSCTCPLAADPPGFRTVDVYPDHITHTYRPLPSIVMLACDFNGDRICDFKDVAIFAGGWLESGIWP